MTSPTAFQLSLRCPSFWADDGALRDPTSLLAQLGEEVARLKRHGAALVEFPAEVCSQNPDYASPEVWQDVARLLRAHGLGATVHLPSTWVDLSSLDRHVWEGSVRSVEVALAAVLPLDPIIAVVHPANHSSAALLKALSETSRETTIGQMVSRFTTALRRLREARGGRVLAVENLEGTPMDLIIRIAQDTDLGVCLDVGHAISDGGDPVHYISAAPELLCGVHLHDALPPVAPGPSGKAHLPLGTGSLDLERLVETLAQHGFSGPVVLEDRGDPESSAARFLAAAARAR